MGGGEIAAKTLELTGVIGAAKSLSNPLERAVSFTTNETYPNNLPDVTTCIILAQKGIYTYDRYVKYMKMYGYNEDAAANMYRGMQALLNPYEYISLYRRGYLSHEQLLIYCKEAGITETIVNQLMAVTEFFPSPGDLVRFAVRDVYNYERRQYFGLDQDISEQYITEALKAGMNRQQASNYWAAHWELPSVLQGYEMLHRRVITDKDLEKLMIAQDIMPFWRDKLKAISYNPLTRVDVRRMWSFGVITEFEDLLNRYKDIGYNDADAKALADFTVVYESDEEQGLTRSAMMDAYKKGIIDKEQLTAYFKGMRYNQKVIDFWIANADYNLTIETVKKWHDDIVNRYLLGDTDLDGVRKDLTNLNLPETYINMALDDLKHQTSAKLKLPSKEDLLSWFNDEIIDEDYFNSRMLLLGYKQEDILNYLAAFYIKNASMKRRFLKVEQYTAWYVKGLLNLEQYTNTLFDMQYSFEDVYNMLLELQPQKEELKYISLNNVIDLFNIHRRSIIDGSKQTIGKIS